MEINNWSIKDGSNPIYYGYSKPGTGTGETLWCILKETSGGTTITREWANNDFSFDKIWNNRASYFVAPSSAPVISSSSVTYGYMSANICSITINWTPIAGVSKYHVSLYEDEVRLSKEILPWNNKKVEIDNDIVNFRYDATPGKTYFVKIRAFNGKGEVSSITTITT